MVRVDAARAALLAVLALGTLGGWGGLPLLYACMFLLGTGDVLCRNAAQVLVPFLTPRDTLSTANARIMGIQEAGAGFVGPLLGALMFGAAVAYRSAWTRPPSCAPPCWSAASAAPGRSHPPRPGPAYWRR